ncbi:MAG TPA: MarR family transcriptional regulator [Bacteroidia bacterium]|jgi:DNA-binding MarR family transcriptional regulator|nr:MarR family transcriptional regulator [Bacteroidia bacterium]
MRLEDELKTKCFQSEELKATLNVMFTASWLHARISCNLKCFGLSHEQFNVLRILKGQHPKPVAQKDILHRMIDRSSNLTRILAKLKGKNLVLVEKSESDRREYEIQLTPAGLELLDAIAASHEMAPNKVIGLTVSEAFHLNALLDKLRENG